MEIPYTVANRRDTGLYNAKVGIWLFLASEVMLFGGLFSGYVFLRSGAQPGVDIPWPSAAEVHGPLVWLGFTNTLVLIASSVFVVMAWAQLKLRNWNSYTLYMTLVLACSATFMVIKGIEYNSKLNKHFGVRLVDGTVIDGKLKYDKGYHGDLIAFKATGADFSLDATGISRATDPYFLKFAEDENTNYKLTFYNPVVNDGKLVFEEQDEAKTIAGPEIEAALTEERKKLLAAAESHYQDVRKELKQKIAEADDSEKKELLEQLESLNPVEIPSRVSAVVDKEGGETFVFKRKDVFRRDIGQDAINFYRGNRITGELVDSTIDLEVHAMDFQMVPNEDESLAWNYLDEGYKAGYQHHKETVREKYQDWVEKGGVIPADKLRIWHHVHSLDEHGGEGAEKHDSHGHEDTKVIQVAESDIKFSSNHGPSFGPYYAIYFTMTGLHGLHVVGGALVLGYFLFFGKKLYRKNPEHLANRVEVGGLFWHFVDLVWIFLFPIFYLL